jgi:transposase
VDAPTPTASQCAKLVMLTSPRKERASMKEVIIVGVDLAKRVFQVHGAAADGAVVFRKKLSRARFLAFLAKLPNCTVAMEACATSHYWGREIAKLGHVVRLIPPIYVKPFVKRQKNDAADAEAIAEAASRRTMRFVAVKTEEQQAVAMAFRARDLLVRQRTQLINALRGHLAEYGVVAAQGAAHLKTLQAAIGAPDTELPTEVREIARMYLDHIAQCAEKIAELEKTIRAKAAKGETTARLRTMPGIGPIGATAIEAFAPPMREFRRGRDFAAWLGLVPRQKSTGGKQILGKTSKMGQRDIRRLLIIGAMAVVRAAVRKGPAEGTWLARMLARKPRMVVAIALANKMARGVWAMLTKQENYRDPMAVA